ncbi:MAG TPA: hypothetical protein VF950_24395 [Planctomycetota bacterium]
MLDLPGLWRAQQQATFPLSALKWVSIDARLGALLTASLRTDGIPRALPPDQREELKKALARAVDVLGQDLEAEARAYFERLVVLGKAVAGGPGEGPPAP